MAWCLPLFSLGQVDLSGTVTSEQKGEPLEGAHIKLQGTYQSTVTDYQGAFEFKDMDQGTYNLKVSYLGYQDTKRKIELDKAKNITVALKPSSILEDEVIVQSTRVDKNAPTTFSNVSRKEIEEENTAQNLPYVLEGQPSMVATSNGGAGVGYSDFRIRGSSPTRINVTINGIPLNDAESHGLFFVNIPDIAGSSESIQLQRGVGTSTNGAGAFGATVNMQTTALKTKPYAELNNSYGSFNTLKNNLKFGTGLINETWAFNGSLSRIQSDGYIDRATSDLKSYYFSGSYHDENTMIKAITFSGREETYQSWWGVVEDSVGKRSKAQNLIGELAQEPKTQPESRNYNHYTYDNQVDNYGQDHYQLHLSQKINDQIRLNGALHYTYGNGYYEQYQQDASLSLHKIQPVTIGDSTITNSDLVRRRWLDNHFYGLTYSGVYEKDRLKVDIGGAWNMYDGAHFGEVIWSRFAGQSEIKDQFYDNDALKSDFNVYAKANYEVNSKLSVFGDLQYRKIGYKTTGLDLDGVDITQEDHLDFFNPKVGLNYALSASSRLYLFGGIGHREPTRDDYIDAPAGATPKPEQLRNVELGYEKQWQTASIKINGYLMDYRNQLVQTGEVNDVGRSIRTNVDNSYRAGIELIGGLELSQRFSWNGNLTLSRNRILDFNYQVDGQLIETYDSKPIAFSPTIIGFSNFTYEPVNNLELSLKSKYVGDQYLDNTESEERMLEKYLLNNVKLSYTVKDKALFRAIEASLEANNIFNVLYSSNGYVFPYLNEGDAPQYTNYYYPQAGRNFMGTLSLKF